MRSKRNIDADSGYLVVRSRNKRVKVTNQKRDIQYRQ